MASNTSRGEKKNPHKYNDGLQSPVHTWRNIVNELKYNKIHNIIKAALLLSLGSFREKEALYYIYYHILNSQPLAPFRKHAFLSKLVLLPETAARYFLSV